MTRILASDVVWLPDGVLITIGERLHVMVMGRSVTVFTDDDAEPAAPLPPADAELAELAEPVPPAQPAGTPDPVRIKNGKALRVPCPSCHVTAGEFCVSKTGKRSPTFHSPRLARARGL